jgi:hypothetical protein
MPVYCCVFCYSQSYPGLAYIGSQELQQVEAPRIFRHLAREGGKVVSPTHRPCFLPRGDPWYLLLLEAESTPGPQRGRKTCQWKISNTPSGIDIATSRLVAQCLNQPPTPFCCRVSIVFYIFILGCLFKFLGECFLCNIFDFISQYCLQITEFCVHCDFLWFKIDCTL